MKKIIIVIFIIGGLYSLFIDDKYSKDWYQSGYKDGYASGFNTKCEIRSSLIHGKWEIEEYKEGYYDGYPKGEKDCKVSSYYKK